MNIPGYDAWILRGPDEHLSVMMEACETCAGAGIINNYGIMQDCNDCCGTGEVEVTLDEPDGDYAYEQARDRRMDE